MITYCIYDRHSGRILQSGLAPDSTDFDMLAKQFVDAGHLVGVDVDSEDHFIVLEGDARVEERPFPIHSSALVAPADGVATITLSMPEGTLVEIDGNEVTIDDGELVLTSDHARTIQVQAGEAFPYRSQTVVVEFVDAP